MGKGLKFFYFLLLIFIISSCAKVEKTVNINSYSSLDSLLSAMTYVDDSLVSQLFVQNFDDSIRSMDTEKRKTLFINSMLSNILAVNEDIMTLRSELDVLQSNFEKNALSDSQNERLDELFTKYRCDSADFECLKSKINIFPPSLILAQAIVESGWGTSRFAIEANSIFGEHFSNGAEGDYIEASGSDIKLRSFPSIKASVESYCLNLNRHRAYRGLRQKRNEMLEKNKLDSFKLCEELQSYSELGEEYVEVLKGIIQSNSLLEYDDFVLNKQTEITKVFINKEKSHSE